MPTRTTPSHRTLPSSRAAARALLAIALTAALPLSLVACGDSAQDTSTAAKGPESSKGGASSKDTAHDGHDHSHDHDHGGDGAPASPDAPAAPAPAEAGTASSGTGLPAGLLLARRPLGAVGVATARMGVRPGEPISLIGRIGGSRSPMVSNRAVFTIVDPEMKCCLETSDEDHCPRPWDYCCSDRTQLAAAMATIEICGPDGKPLALALEQEGTLKPLTLIAVNGVLEAPDASGSFVIRAKGIYLMPNDPLAERIKAFRQ